MSLQSLCINTVTIAARSPTYGTHGELTDAYGSGTDYAASVQPLNPDRMTVNGTVEAMATHAVYFAVLPAVKVDDRLSWTDSGGTTHHLYALGGPVDMAGRGRAFRVLCRATEGA